MVLVGDLLGGIIDKRLKLRNWAMSKIITTDFDGYDWPGGRRLGGVKIYRGDGE